MKLAKCGFKAKTVSGFRAAVREGEPEGKLGVQLKLDGDLAIGKLQGFYEDPAEFERSIAAHYDEKGKLLSPGLGRFKLKYEGSGGTAKLEFDSAFTLETDGADLDQISIELAEGRCANVRARLRWFPKASQQSRIQAILKNSLQLGYKGDSIIAETTDEDPDQEKLDLGGGEPAGAKVLPAGAPALQQGMDGPADAEAAALAAAHAGNAASTAALEQAGVISTNGNGNGSGKPSTAHGEVQVEGQKPPQRPRGVRGNAPPKTTH